MKYNFYLQYVLRNCVDNAEKPFLIYDNGKEEVVVKGKNFKKCIENYAFAFGEKMQQQDCALIVLPQGLEYIYSLLGCWYKNITAIPTAILENTVKESDILKLITYSEDSLTRNIISNTQIIEKLKSLDQLRDFEFINIDKIDTSLERECNFIESTDTDLALLMYTSGSTSKPKGVMLTHKNVMNQVLAEQWRIDSHTRMVTWIPQFHAFGLHNNILVPLFKNALSVIISPGLFIKDPTYYFKLIKKYNGTHTAMPNFAFDYCINNINLDLLPKDTLCTLKAIVSAGEPIRIESYLEFEKKFETIGLKKDVLCPMLGLSELCPVSTKKIDEKPKYVTLDIELLEKGIVKIIENKKIGKNVVSCGPIEKPDEIVIVNLETKQECNKNQIGEVWIRSARKGSGYLNNKASTEESFYAKLKNSDSKTYFRTGDNGFIYENELFIVGRCKEIIIINGKKYHQVDIEWTIKNSIPELTLPTCVFSCEIDNKEKVIVVQEIKKNLSQMKCKEISKKIVKAISERFSIEIYEVNLVEENQIPKTGSGKIQKKESAKKYKEGQYAVLYKFKKNDKICRKTEITKNTESDTMLSLLKEIFIKALNLKENIFDEIELIAELNITSIENIQIAKYISESFGIEFEPFMMYQFSNLHELQDFILEDKNFNKENKMENVKNIPSSQEKINDHDYIKNTNPNDIAIIGISCDLPGAADTCDKFWNNNIQHKNCVQNVEAERPCIIVDYLKHNRTDEFCPKWGGFIQDINKFDSSFFGISNIEAECMDPQQRKALEMAWNVIEDAGYSPKELAGQKVGVYIGVHNNDYADLLLSETNAVDIYGGYADSGVHMSLIANRISRLFNFHGPSEIVNTACSSSLVAIHNAVESLKRKECKVAIAGGINLILSSRVYVACEKAGMLSKIGKCKTFDQSADGFVRAEGCGAVLLKPYSEAIKDNDNIYGIIKGSEVNHDGTSSSLRAPNMQAQKELIKSVYEKSKIPFSTISYIETHGTGTALGDPIEIKALVEAALEMDIADKKNYCGIGSVKTIIGHTEAASGVAGLIKVLMAMKYKLLPGITNMTDQNSYIHLDNTPFYIVKENQHWAHLYDSEGNIIPRRAGVSSFGFGGTNAHIIVEEPYDFSERMKSVDNTKEEIMILSAKTKAALKMEAEQLLEYLKGCDTEKLSMSHLSYTLLSVRGNMRERWGCSVENLAEFIEKLSGFVREECETKANSIITSNNEHCLQVDGTGKCVNDNFIHQSIEQKNYNELISLWKDGATINWKTVFENRKGIKRLHLPTYPFQKKDFWLLGKNPYQKLDDIPNNKNYEASKEEMITDTFEKLKDREVNHLKTIFSKLSKYPIDEISKNVDLGEYGIDSIIIKSFCEELEKELGSVPVSIFFEYRTIEDLAEYILNNYESQVKSKLGYKSNSKLGINSMENANELDKKSDLFSSSNQNTCEQNVIAIIGISGKYPKANNLDELWENLKHGRNCIEEIPSNRWDWRDTFDKDKMKTGKINSKWGGFIEDVDAFDPLFFNITPQEAEKMDPQERLFLQCVYNTIEDAGYTRDSLKKYKENNIGGNVGVFVGATFSDYHLYGVEEQLKGNMIALSGSNSSIANRVSYYFDFTGPSIAIDTMCSSSLTAIHLACNSIYQNECKMAIAGGVNLSLHPNKYLFLSQHNFLSNEGRCDSFGNEGNGYVPGEGVGSILLKKLSDAIADGDHIYGIIKATAINHGGKTNGFYVPNPAAQANVISKALSDAHLNPENISYIEAHGTGTALGDPIEIAGLTKAFRKYTNKNMFCSIGSIKSNIGHLEAAAGIAAVTKVLLQLKYKQLVPSIHSEILNDKIDFKNTPFKIQDKLEKWDRKNGLPLIAGISSFGAGGSNSHIIIEEYKDNISNDMEEDFSDNTALILLSAKNEDSLKKQAINLLNSIKENDVKRGQLKNIEYTLQVGREAMKERIAFTANSIEDLTPKLRKYINNSRDMDGFYYNAGKENPTISSILNGDNDFLDTLKAWYKRGKFSILLKLWVCGLDIDWENFYSGRRPKKISLKGYDFTKGKYWLFNSKKELAAENKNKNSTDKNEKKTQTSEIMNDEYSEVLCTEILDKIEDFEPNYKYDFEKRIAIIIGDMNTEKEDENKKIFKDSSVYFFNQSNETIDEEYEKISYSLLFILKELMRNKAKTLIQLVILNGEKNIIFTGLESMLKTAAIENPEIEYQTILIQYHVNTIEIIKILNDFVNLNINKHYVISKKEIFQRKLKPLSLGEYVDIPWKENGIYLLTGGMGKLSQVFVKEIVDKIKSAKIILLGRSDLDDKKKEEFYSLQRNGAQIEYIKADVADQEALEECINELIYKYGRIDGILHTAGVIKDKLIIHKSQDDLNAVYRPKVKGAISLDKATQKLKLDFIVLFSSGAAEMGSMGQADYAAANAFMDTYCVYRNSLVSKGECSGKMISINWPLWKEGGMRVNDKIEQVLFRDSGMIPINSQNGIKLLYKALQTDLSHITVLAGNLRLIKNKLENRMDSKGNYNCSIAPEIKDIIINLKQIFADVTKLSIDQIDEKEYFETFGVDSVMLTLINHQLSNYFRKLPSTILYECNTLSSLGNYLLSKYYNECALWISNQTFDTTKVIYNSNETYEGETVDILDNKVDTENCDVDSRIAIIGASGRFPDANNLDQYFENLVKGRNCITEIKPSRWELDDFYISDKSQAMEEKRSYSKWGGFLDGFYNFDSLFFNIAPAEARYMDPQERIFMEECWKSLEDAGYMSKRLNKNLKKQTGVYGAITNTGFELWNNSEEKYFRTSFSSMVNRFSYFMDFEGPSLAFDTMCSSSLVALHEACRDLKENKIKMAVVGAVNLYLHPNNYINLCHASLISKTNSSSVLAKNGDGFTPSEGVGAVVLKRMDDAIKDNDNILGIISGSAISHSGRTSGYCIPDPAKQATVMEMAIKNANIEKNTIQHIELAANGSSLVDRIEMSAIEKVFKDEKIIMHSTLGNVKALIGHGESVSGMAQLLKCILMFNKKIIFPMKCPQELNPDIDLDKIPFTIPENAQKWDKTNESIVDIPRRAIINSFGSGGVYSSLILEEYSNNLNECCNEDILCSEYLFVFSAKTQSALNNILKQWLIYLETKQDIDLKRISYILQTRRTEFKVRFASIADSSEQLMLNIQKYLSNTDVIYNFSSKIQKENYSNANGDSVENMKGLTSIAKRWVFGQEVNWNILYKSYESVQEFNLPTYQFDQKKYWVKTSFEENKIVNDDFVPLEKITLPKENSLSKDCIQKENTFSELSCEEKKMTIKPELDAIQLQIKKVVGKVLFIDEYENIDEYAAFRELGMDSLYMANFVNMLNTEFSIHLDETVLFEYTNIKEIAKYLYNHIKVSMES